MRIEEVIKTDLEMRTINTLIIKQLIISKIGNKERDKIDFERDKSLLKFRIKNEPLESDF